MDIFPLFSASVIGQRKMHELHFSSTWCMLYHFAIYQSSSVLIYKKSFQILMCHSCQMDNSELALIVPFLEYRYSVFYMLGLTDNLKKNCCCF